MFLLFIFFKFILTKYDVSTQYLCFLMICLAITVGFPLIYMH